MKNSEYDIIYYQSEDLYKSRNIEVLPEYRSRKKIDVKKKEILAGGRKNSV
jgi:hypothetical protein